jgi:hypothetical protein
VAVHCVAGLGRSDNDCARFPLVIQFVFELESCFHPPKLVSTVSFQCHISHEHLDTSYKMMTRWVWLWRSWFSSSLWIRLSKGMIRGLEIFWNHITSHILLLGHLLWWRCRWLRLACLRKMLLCLFELSGGALSIAGIFILNRLLLHLVRVLIFNPFFIIFLCLLETNPMLWKSVWLLNFSFLWLQGILQLFCLFQMPSYWSVHFEFSMYALVYVVSTSLLLVHDIFLCRQLQFLSKYKRRSTLKKGNCRSQ